MRHGQQRGGEWVRHLVLDHLRRLARILGVDDDLRIGEIGQRVERRVENGPDAHTYHEQRGEQHEQHVPGTEINHYQPTDHCFDPCVNPCRAARRLLSASIRKLAPITTRPPGRDAVGDLNPFFATGAEMDFPGFEPALATVDQNDLTRAAVEYRRIGHGQRKVAGADTPHPIVVADSIELHRNEAQPYWVSRVSVPSRDWFWLNKYCWNSSSRCARVRLANFGPDIDRKTSNCRCSWSCDLAGSSAGGVTEAVGEASAFEGSGRDVSGDGLARASAAAA
ncbi:MAG: hypothetical protein JWQ16_56 [Novosphingobium sp.]|nr:hypothetical protein [Novosphingobium sp.]